MFLVYYSLIFFNVWGSFFLCVFGRYNIMIVILKYIIENIIFGVYGICVVCNWFEML